MKMSSADGILNCLKEATDRMPTWLPDEYRDNRRVAGGRCGPNADSQAELQPQSNVADSRGHTVAGHSGDRNLSKSSGSFSYEGFRWNAPMTSWLALDVYSRTSAVRRPRDTSPRRRTSRRH